jgi:CheY-like chemotaxis protein
MRILLADDNETNRMLARTILAGEGYAVDEAVTGAEAVEFAHARNYDLILMDVSMPDMDGLTATRAIRQFGDRAGRVPVLAMTAHAMAGDRERCLAAGMDDYIAKPVNRTVLLAAIGRWLAARPRPVNPGDGGDPAAQGPLDDAAFSRLTADLGGALLPDVVGGFIADARGHGLHIGRAMGESSLSALEAEASALAELAETFGARHLRHCAAALADAARLGQADAARALAASVTHLTDEAIEAMMAKLSG